MEKQIAFVGNPNVGKSAWINALSDAHFKVGNWPGVTIEKKEAIVTWQQTKYHLIDLPGTYALDEESNEEGITARYLHHEHVDLIVNVVDATNLSRNLYLTLLLRELQIPMLLIFNFMDEVEAYHIQLHISEIQEALQVPIYPYSAFDPKGYEIIRQAICTEVEKEVEYSPCIRKKDQGAFHRLSSFLRQQLPHYVKMHDLEFSSFCYRVFTKQMDAMRQLQSWDIELTDQRFCAGMQDTYAYAYIEDDIMPHVIMKEERFAKTRKMDGILLHPIFGWVSMVLIFMFLMLFVFQGSAPFNDFIDFFIHDMVMKYANALLFFLPDSAKALLLDGILAGVGGVLVFVPLMAFLYFILSLLEESGYMARIAYLLDTFMHHFHLSGKSFVSLLLGFGCNVPAIYATRTLDQVKQKKLTALLVPFMSCGARLPVYMLFAAAFFQEKAALMILSIYGIGILIALLLALCLSHMESFQEDSLYILELPPYRLPSLKIVFRKVRLEVKGYVQKATSVVMWAMIVLWALTYFPTGQIESSYIAQFGKQSAPIFEPLGFGTRWECISALPGSVIAKETVVGFMSQILLHEEVREVAPLAPLEDMKQIVYGFGSACHDFVLAFVPHYEPEAQDESLVSAISSLWQDRYANLRAYSYMVYILLSIPCVMSLQALAREYGLRFMCLSIFIMLVIPYLVSFFIFQFFSLLL